MLQNRTFRLHTATATVRLVAQQFDSCQYSLSFRHFLVAGLAVGSRQLESFFEQLFVLFGELVFGRLLFEK